MRCLASALHAVLRPAVRWSRAATAVFGLALACGVPAGAQPAGQTSTPGEYGRFLTMLLSGGTFRGRRILSESFVAQSDMEKSLSVYLRLKILLRKQTGQAQMSQRGEKP